MSRRSRERSAAVAAKELSLAPDDAECCEHGISFADYCAECEQEVIRYVNAEYDGVLRDEKVTK